MYQKEIIYMGLYKDGDRLGNAGFLRVEKRDRKGKLSLAVKNVPYSIEGRFPVRYYSGTDWKEEDGITLRGGSGQWEKQELDFAQQVRLQITLPGGYLVEGESKTAKPAKSAALQEEKPAEKAREQTPAEKQDISGKRQIAEEPAQTGQAVATQLSVEAGEEPSGPAAKRENEGRLGGTERKRPDVIEHIAVQRQEKTLRTDILEPEPAKLPLMADAFVMEGLKEDKWEQILDTYEQIHPYGDERVYVKLTPKDFIILSAKYQHLVNNSFLLHGFYNYRHVILGKEREYYLGVPGVYYEREKMVALMFGLEAFECAGGESRDGEFGYYLRKVEL